MKGMAITLMIVAHSLQILLFASNSSYYLMLPTRVLSHLSNQSTFIILFFAFGYVLAIMLEKNPTTATPRLFRIARNVLLMYYTSATAWQFMCIDGFSFVPDHYRDILLLSRPMPYSEFLLAYFFVTVVVTLLFRPLAALSSKRPAALLAIGVLLIASPYLGTRLPDVYGLRYFLGPNPQVFPIIPYLPYVLLGIYCRRRPIPVNWHIFLGAAAISAPAIAYYLTHGLTLPSRFPPSTLFLTGGVVFLETAYILAHHLAATDAIPGLRFIGQNSAWYFVGSNLLLFACRSAIGAIGLHPLSTMLTAAAVILACTVSLKQYRVLRTWLERWTRRWTTRPGAIAK